MKRINKMVPFDKELTLADYAAQIGDYCESQKCSEKCIFWTSWGCLFQMMAPLEWRRFLDEKLNGGTDDEHI